MNKIEYNRKTVKVGKKINVLCPECRQKLYNIEDDSFVISCIYCQTFYEKPIDIISRETKEQYNFLDI